MRPRSRDDVGSHSKLRSEENVRAREHASRGEQAGEKPEGRDGLRGPRRAGTGEWRPGMGRSPT